MSDPVEGLELRLAEEGDVATVYAFIKELAEYENMRDEMTAREKDIAEALFGERPVMEALLAEVDGEPVGFAVFFPTISTFHGRPGLYVEDLFVRPADRGRGIGRALLRRLARIARERDYARMELAVLDWNASSIAFYKQLGAFARDEWTIFRFDEDALDKLA